MRTGSHISRRGPGGRSVVFGVVALWLLAVACVAGTPGRVPTASETHPAGRNQRVSITGKLEAADALHVTRRSQTWENTTAPLTKLVPEGSRVEQGDTLFETDPTPVERRVQAAEGELKARQLVVTSALSELAALEGELEATRQSVPLQLASCRLNVERLKALPDPVALAEAEAEVARLEAVLQEHSDNVQALESLAARELCSRHELALARFDRDIAAADLEYARAHLQKVRRGADPHGMAIAEVQQRAAAMDLDLAVAEMEVKVAEERIDVQTATREVAVQEGKVASWKQELEFHVRRAPESGIVAYEEIQTGRDRYEKATVGATAHIIEPVVSIIGGGKFQFRGKASEALISKLRPGLPVRVRLEALADTTLRGRLETFEVALQTQENTTAKALVDLESPDPKVFDVIVALDEVPEGLMPGLSGEAEIDLHAPQEAETRSPYRAPVDLPRSEGFCCPGYVAAQHETMLVTPNDVMGFVTRIASQYSRVEEGDVVLEITGDMARSRLAEVEHLPPVAEERLRLAKLAAKTAAARGRSEVEKAELARREAQLRLEQLQSLPDEGEARMADARVKGARLQLERADEVLAIARAAGLDSKQELERKELAAQVAQLRLRKAECNRSLARRAPLPRALAHAEWRVRHAREGLRHARKWADRAAKLHLKLIAEAEVELRNGRDAVASAQAFVERRTLRAPVAGDVVLLPQDHRHGQTLQPGDYMPNWSYTLGYICDLKKLKFCAVVDEPHASRIEPGDAAAVRLLAMPDRILEGTVATVMPLMREREQVRRRDERRPSALSHVRSTRVDVVLELPEQTDTRILPGMTGTAVLIPRGT